MARAVWKGAISFGLVNVPVEVYTADQSNAMSFAMLDKKDFAPVGYRRYNKKSGKEVPLRGSNRQRDQGSMLATEDAFESAPLFETAPVGAGGLVEVQQPVPVNRVVGHERQHADELAPVLVTGRGQRIADAPDDDDVLPFHPARRAAVNTFDGPGAGKT